MPEERDWREYLKERPRLLVVFMVLYSVFCFFGMWGIEVYLYDRDPVPPWSWTSWVCAICVYFLPFMWFHIDRLEDWY